MTLNVLGDYKNHVRSVNYFPAAIRVTASTIKELLSGARGLNGDIRGVQRVNYV